MGIEWEGSQIHYREYGDRKYQGWIIPSPSPESRKIWEMVWGDSKWEALPLLGVPGITLALMVQKFALNLGVIKQIYFGSSTM